MAIISPAPGETVGDYGRKPAGRGWAGFRESQAVARQLALEKRAGKYKLPLGELAVFTRQLASLLAAGLPLVQCLEALQDQTQDRVFQVVLREVRAEISSGTPFSEAVRQYPRTFNHLFVSMVEAGEASGNLAEILGKVAEYFEATVKLTKKLKSAMTYPIAVISMAVILVAVLLIFVIPIFAKMFADFGAQLPLPTRILIAASNFLQHNVFYLLGLLAIAVWLVRRWFTTPRGRRFKDLALVRAPIFGGLVRKIALSRFCRTYATLIRSGVPILRTLQIVSAASGKVQIEEACAAIAREVAQGGQVSAVLTRDPFFPPMVRHMVKAGETTGDVDGMLNKVSDFYDVEIDAAVGSLTSLIEPMLMVFLGVVVGGIVITMYLPIFQMGLVAGGLQH